VTWGEVERLADGVTEDELSRCKAQAKSSLIMQQESTSARASSIASDWFQLQRVQSLEEIHQRVEQVTVNDVGHFLTAFRPKAPTIVTVRTAPLSAPTP